MGFPGSSAGQESVCNAGDRRRRFDPWVRKIPPTQSGLAQKDQETVERDAVCIQNLLPTSFQFQGLLPLWLWELGKREGPFDLNGSMSAAGRFPWSCSGLADYWGWNTERVCACVDFQCGGRLSPWCSPFLERGCTLGGVLSPLAWKPSQQHNDF